MVKGGGITSEPKWKMLKISHIGFPIKIYVKLNRIMKDWCMQYYLLKLIFEIGYIAKKNMKWKKLSQGCKKTIFAS